MNLPDHPFWDYSLALYARPGVADACLRLQDGLGLDVNLLLYACWSATTGSCPAVDDWRWLVDETRSWQDRVVEPIRSVRRHLKDAEPSAWASSLRDRVKVLELQAEHVEQLLIATLAEPRRSKAADALEAMLDYIGALGLSPSESDRADLSVIAAGAGSIVTEM